MRDVKRNGITDAGKIDRVAMVGDTMWVAGTTPGLRAATDISQQPAPVHDTLQRAQALNQQREKHVAMDAQQRQQDQDGAGARGASAMVQPVRHGGRRRSLQPAPAGGSALTWVKSKSLSRSHHARAISQDRTVRQQHAEGRRPPHAVFRAMWQSAGQAGGDAAWRPGRRLQRQDATLPRPGQVPHRVIRSARFRPLHAACRSGRQHHLGSGGRYRTAAHTSGHRPLAGVRWQLGFHIGARLRADPSATGHRVGAARHFPAASFRAGMVLSARRQPSLSGCVGALHQRDSAGGTCRSDVCVPSPPHQRRRGHASGGSQGLERVGRRHQLSARGRGLCHRARGRAFRSGVRAHREPLLRQRRFLRGRRPVAARRASHCRHSRRDRARPLRCGVPAAKRLGSAQGMAQSAAADQPGLGAFGLRAGECGCLGTCNRWVCVSDCVRVGRVRFGRRARSTRGMR
ncbi:conserved hypothetical protein [Xanthomonas oryzae pv. oryzae KACC 10331]|uniref:Uncharacterized protein n=1 Tax=Xanthomonas oryzae pv. oryzae (strain KACC10331 / KXO85) TaxID=291331 RepID=Q5GWM6_XANOR|nr:conserved hypothetical protein [Xanthomonas oryzae pv. oryzae KACC 10331]